MLTKQSFEGCLLKMKEGTTSQGKRMCSREERDRDNSLCLQNNQLCEHPVFISVIPISDF